MSKLDKLEIIAGTVVEVQIIERQLESAPALGGEGKGTTAIIGRQRIFIDGPAAADPHYDFDRCELAVRREQEVAFARMPGKGGKPVNVMLVNRTMGTQWPFAEAIDQLSPPSGLGVTAKAIGLAVVIAVMIFLLLDLVIMRGDVMQALLLSVAAGLAAALVLWVVFSALNMGSAKRRREGVIAAVFEKLKQAPLKAA